MKASTHADVTPMERKFTKICCGGKKCSHHTRLVWIGVELALSNQTGTARAEIAPRKQMTPRVRAFMERRGLESLDPDQLAAELDTAYRRFIRTHAPEALSTRWGEVA